LRTISNITRSQQLCNDELNRFSIRQSLLSLSLTEAKRNVENMPFGALALRVICHEVSSPSIFFGATEFFYGNHFTIESRQKATI